MHVQQISVQGEDFIGLLGMASDRYAILSPRFPETEALDAPLIKATVYGTHLVGLFCAGNSNGLLLPYFISDSELAGLKKAFKEEGVDLNIALLEEKTTALGNVVCCNDKKAILSPALSETQKIADALDVEVIQMMVGDHEEVGACCVATNKGFICHPDAEYELDKLAETLGVPGMEGSVNFGFPFVKSGLIANSKGYLVGARTSGIELGRIDDALGFLE